jgi:hypothetical protein
MVDGLCGYVGHCPFLLFEVQLIYLTLGSSCLQVTVIMLREFVLFFDVEVIGMTWDETLALLCTSDFIPQLKAVVVTSKRKRFIELSL